MNYKDLCKKGQICFMSKTPKKQSLLGKTPARKNTTQKNKTRATSQRQAQTKQHTIDTELNSQNPKPKKGLLITLAIIAVIIIAFPKPTLLTYKKLGMVSKSIYWPGVFGYGATLVDSHLHPKFDDKRKSLYLCSDLQNPQSCQKYQVIADDGLISAIKSYF